MAVLAVLAFAFNRPFFNTLGARGEQAIIGKRSVVLLVDCSASMMIGGRMDKAKKDALAIVDGLKAGDHVAVYAFGAGLRPVTTWTDDYDKARKAVETLGPGDGAGNLSGALRQLNEMMVTRARPGGKIVVCSDMQAASWRDYRGDWRKDKSVGLSLIDSHTGDVPGNLGIVKISTPAQAVMGSEPELITAQLKNYTPNRRRVTLSLELAGKSIDKREISMPPEATTSFSFRHEFDSVGDTAGKFVLNVKDALAIDNEVNFVVRVKPKIKVVLVNGSTDPNPKNNDGYYLRRALVPGRESIFQLTEIRAEKLASTRLGDIGAVVLSDVASMPAAGIRKLTEFVQKGGGVMFFTGTATTPDKFNRMFADVAPCRLGRMVDAVRESPQKRPLVIAEVDYQSPIFEAFSKPHHGDFSRVNFRSCFSVRNSQAADVLARFDDEKPAVLMKKVGKGTSLLIVSSADLEMSDFALRGVFLPFVHQAAKLLSAHGGAQKAHAAVGYEFTYELPEGVSVAKLKTPSGTTTTLNISAGNTEDAGPSGRFVRFAASEQGIYSLSTEGEEHLFAANVDPVEGNLVPMLRKEIMADGTGGLGTDGDGNSLEVVGATRRAEDVERSQNIGWFLLLVASGLLVSEMVLAYRITTRE